MQICGLLAGYPGKNTAPIEFQLEPSTYLSQPRNADSSVLGFGRVQMEELQEQHPISACRLSRASWIR